MFTNISWGTYTLVVASVSVSWYLFVGLRYYSKEIRLLAMPKSKRPLQAATSTALPATAPGLPIPEDQSHLAPAGSFGESTNDIFDEIEIFIERAKEVIALASQRKSTKEEFGDLLSPLLMEYPTLKDSMFRSSLNELIAQESEKQQGIALTIDEVEKLWL
jgi:hypothetical protein